MKSTRRIASDARYTIASIALITGVAVFANLGSVLQRDVKRYVALPSAMAPSPDKSQRDCPDCGDFAPNIQLYNLIPDTAWGSAPNIQLSNTTPLIMHPHLGYVSDAREITLPFEIDAYPYPPITEPAPTRLGQIHLTFADADVVKQQLTGIGGPKIDLTIPSDVINRSVFGDIGRQVAPGPISPGSLAPNATTILPAEGGAGRPGGHSFNRGSQVGGAQYRGGIVRPQQEVPEVRGLLPAGIEPNDLTALSNNNVLIVRYRDDAEGEAAFRQLQAIIGMLDVNPQRIQLQAQFVTVTQNDADQLGINWQFQKVNLLGNLNPGYAPSEQAVMQFASGDLQTQLNFALSMGRGEVVASKTATTFNNVAAQFTDTITYYSFVPETFIGPGGIPQRTYYPSPVPATSSLFVTPHINSDNTITLTSSLQFQDESGIATSPDGTDYPILVSQEIPVTRIIRNGETMVFGRLIPKQDQSDNDTVPLLGHLPFITSLYRSPTINANDSELLIFITATIVSDPTTVGSTEVTGGLTAPAKYLPYENIGNGQQPDEMRPW